MPDFLMPTVFYKRAQRTLRWIAQSIYAGDGGSAAAFHLWKGWAPPYPETTGYLIETLFDYGHYFKEKQWENLAIHCADWLCCIQRADGAFPGGVGVNGEPVVFDTGQILFGLSRAFVESKDTKYYDALAKAVNWLLSVLKDDGSWQQHSYTKNYIPSYYTRVIWAILYANHYLKNANIHSKMQQALHYYVNKITPQLSVKNWAFAPDELAFTHTIAYTLRGLLESAILLQDEFALQQAFQMMNKWMDILHQYKKMAGRYDINWQGDYTFTCVTGNAQTSLLFARAYQYTDNQLYLNTSILLFDSIVHQQWTLPIAGFNGAIPGSVPFWGAYQTFRFPNWAAKFYLDAYLKLMQLQKKVGTSDVPT